MAKRITSLTLILALLLTTFASAAPVTGTARAFRVENLMDVTYNAAAQTPKPVVTNGVGAVLREGADYRLTYYSNTNAGTATVTVTGVGDYGAATVGGESLTAVLAQQTFRIAKRELYITVKSVAVRGNEQPSFGYSITSGTLAGADRLPEPEYRLYDRTADTRGITAVFGGTVSANYDIHVTDGVLTYSGAADPTPTGTATVGSIAAVTYNGKAQTPEPTLTASNGVTLRKGVDYTLSYSNNVNAGTATCTVTGIGAYAGQLYKSVAFTIKPAPVTVRADDVRCRAAYAPTTYDYSVSGTVYNGDYIGDVTVRAVSRSNYTYGPVFDLRVTVSNVNPNYAVTTRDGTMTYTDVDGYGYYDGYYYDGYYYDGGRYGDGYYYNGRWYYYDDASGPYYRGYSYTGGSIRMDAVSSVIYDGDYQEPSVTVRNANGYVLREGTDYTLDYSNNLHAGTATVTAVGKGNYAGARYSRTFAIERKAITVTVADATVVQYDRYVGTYTVKPALARGDSLGRETWTSVDTSRLGRQTVKVSFATHKDYDVTVKSGTVTVLEALPQHTALGTPSKLPTSISGVNPYRDVKRGAWYEYAVVYCHDNGLMLGVTSDTFLPNGQVTRAQVVTAIYRLSGSPRVYGTSHFTDLQRGSWYEDAVVWASQNGIVEGYDSTVFAPAGRVTREQLASILYRYATVNGFDASQMASLAGYTDYSQIAAGARDAMSWAVAAKVLGGRTRTGVQPKADANRAELAGALYSFALDYLRR